MNYKMPEITKIKTLPAFLKYHRIKKADNKEEKPITHTRIGDPNGKITGKVIYGGSYHIPEDAMPHFWKLYYKYVFELGNNEYLTETQNIANGNPVLVDIDMRFDKSITERIYDDEDICAIVELYCESFKELFNFKSEIEIPLYIFQKDNVVTQDDKETKDGLHLVFGVHMKHNLQMLLTSEITFWFFSEKFISLKKLTSSFPPLSRDHSGLK